MSDKEQTEALEAELERLIDRYRIEFEVSYAVVVGVLMLQVHRLSAEAEDNRQDDWK